MRRELKGESRDRLAGGDGDGAKFFPMRRELKGEDLVDRTNLMASVAEFFPMRRELKDENIDPSSLSREGSLSFSL